VYVPFCGLAVMDELSGVKTAINDPMAGRAASMGGQDPQPHQDEIIRRAERYASPRCDARPRTLVRGYSTIA
jgi:hypothetical protein